MRIHITALCEHTANYNFVTGHADRDAGCQNLKWTPDSVVHILQWY